MTTTMGFDSKGNVRRSPWRLNALVCCMALAGYAQAAPHEVNGQPGDPASWRSAEFNANWGLGAIHADEAYAAGYTGKGKRPM